LIKVDPDGAEIYREVRGDGPPVLFVQGALGDGGTFDSIADLLGNEFTVITYDRRGNSRSPRPPGYSTMLMRQQAEDAAVLIREVSPRHALVFATSGGALIGLELLLRYPELVQAAILHEPAMLAILDDGPFQDVPRRLAASLTQAVAVEPDRIAEMFVRSGSGDATWESLDTKLRRRLQGNGRMFAELEFGTFASYHPADAELARATRPVLLLAGTESAPFRRYICDWLAARLRCTVASLPGGHMAYLDHPEESAQVLRRALRTLSQADDHVEASA
jgi:pimeloyl-ACP methyl ester carboxylesterase